MDVACSCDIDETEYVRFLDRFAGRPSVVLAYHYPFYLRFLATVAYPGSRPRFVVSRNERGELAGVMPAVNLRTGRLNVWLSLAYFGPNAGALVPDAETPGGAAAVRALTAAAQADARELGCGSMTVYTPLAADGSWYRDGLSGADFDVPRVALSVAIPKSPDESPWPRKVRYDIRRAESLGVTVRPIENATELDAVWDIYRDGCEAAGIPIKAREHIRCLYRTARERGIFLAAEHGREIVAGLIALMGGGVVSYYLPCSRSDKRLLQPGLALLDRAVAIARAAGCRLLNFEGSPSVESSVYKFKTRCGGRPMTYRVLVKLLRAGVLDEYRALGSEAIGREAPHAFIVPFEALAS